MSQRNSHTEAKGLYTFTTIEKIEHRYGVIASSWDEAQEEIDNYNHIKLNNGDHSGGCYIEETNHKKDKLIRKQTCVGVNFTMTRIQNDAFNKNQEVQFANVDHSQHIYIPEYEAHEGYETQTDEEGEDVKVMKIHAENGLCSVCNAMLSRHGYQKWSLVPKREATHTTWGRKLESEGEE